MRPGEKYLGRTVYCHNSDCKRYGYVHFRQVIVESFVDHEKLTFTCPGCGSMHIVETERVFDNTQFML